MNLFATVWKAVEICFQSFIQFNLHTLKAFLCKVKCVFFCLRTKVNDFASDAGSETGILALSLMSNRTLHTFERALWFFIVLGSIFGAIRLSNQQYTRYINSPTVISVDRDYRDWNGSLPAITLCYYDHIDSFRANEYIQDNWNVSVVDEDYFYFMDFLYSVVNASASNYADLARFAEDERFDDVDLFDLLRAIERPFEQVITSFDVDFEVQVIPVMTERGSCYAINSPISELLTGSLIEYKELKSPLICKFGKQQCFVKMDLYESTGTIDIHSPYEISATDANIFGLRKADEIAASYKVIETVASENLRDLSVDQRKCVFHDEETSNLKIYSKSLCLVRCRAVMALEMCNCVPFFYQFIDGPSCNPAGFECLLDFKWPVWALHICKCPSTCTEIVYSVQTVKKSSWGVKVEEVGVKSDMVTSSFRWDLIPPKVRMRRDVVFSFADLLVSLGGAIALFLGCSLLSIVQLGYVLTYHILITIGEMLLLCCKFCKRIFRFNSQPQLLRSSSIHNFKEVKSKNRTPAKLKIKRKLLAAIHRKPSEESFTIDEVKNIDKRSEEINEWNSSNDNLNATFAKPEFQYLE